MSERKSTMQWIWWLSAVLCTVYAMKLIYVGDPDRVNFLTLALLCIILMRVDE